MINSGFLYKMTNTECGYNLVANVRKKLMTKIVCRGLGSSPVHNTRVKLVEVKQKPFSKITSIESLREQVLKPY